MPLSDEEIADIQQRIADIDAVLAGGVTAHSADGESWQVDLRALERERRRLKRKLSGRRPMFRRINTSNVNP